MVCEDVFLRKFSTHHVFCGILVSEFKFVSNNNLNLIMLIENVTSHVVRLCITLVESFLHQIESPFDGVFGVALA